MSECPLCSSEQLLLVAENDLAVAFRDAYPVTPLHTLVVPRRHVELVFDMTREETEACLQLVMEAKAGIEAEDREVQGFNVGVNAGEYAGQTVLHCHIHVIPRRRGDVPSPTGGIRNVIPGKGAY